MTSFLLMFLFFYIISHSAALQCFFQMNVPGDPIQAGLKEVVTELRNVAAAEKWKTAEDAGGIAGVSGNNKIIGIVAVSFALANQAKNNTYTQTCKEGQQCCMSGPVHGTDKRVLMTGNMCTLNCNDPTDCNTDFCNKPANVPLPSESMDNFDSQTLINIGGYIFLKGLEKGFAEIFNYQISSQEKSAIDDLEAKIGYHPPTEPPTTVDPSASTIAPQTTTKGCRLWSSFVGIVAILFIYLFL